MTCSRHVSTLQMFGGDLPRRSELKQHRHLLIIGGTGFERPPNRGPQSVLDRCLNIEVPQRGFAELVRCVCVDNKCCEHACRMQKA